MNQILKIVESKLNELLKKEFKTNEDKRNIDEIKACVKFFQLVNENGFSLSNVDEIIKISPINNGYSNYHIMTDNEVDDRNLWSEVVFNKEHKTLNEGDIIIKFK